MTQDQLAIRTRARAMRDVVVRALADVVPADVLAIGGEGYVTTLGDLMAGIVSAICADRHAKATGARLQAAVAALVDHMSTADDLDRIRRGWEHILHGEDAQRQDHLATIAGYHLRFSQATNSVSGLIRHHWSIVPSAEVADPALAACTPPTTARLVERRAALAALFDVADESKVRLLATSDRHHDLIDPDRPLPRLSSSIGNCVVVVDGMDATLHADPGFAPRALAVDLPSSVLLHAPVDRMVAAVAKDFDLHFGERSTAPRPPSWGMDASDEDVETVRRWDALDPAWGPMRVETWFAQDRVEVRIDHLGADPDTLHRIPHMIQATLSSRRPSPIDGFLSERHDAIARLTARVGEPPAEGDAPPLDAYLVDVPLVRALEAEGRDVRDAIATIVAGEVLRRRMEQQRRRSQSDGDGSTIELSQHPGIALIERYGIEFVSGRIKARFDLAPGVLWDGGTLLAKGASFPQVVLNALAEQPVERMVDHPFITGLTMRRVKVGLKGARADIVRPARPLA